MDKVILGRSGLKVSPICFGTWELGGEWGVSDDASATAAIRRARELDINFFDTAQGYGFGESEQVLGRALADELRAHRDEIVIATKGGLRQQGDHLVRDASREWLHAGVNASLRALNVDVIDLYQVHWPDPKTSFEETAGALAELVETGKIRHVGVSNFDPQQMDALAEHGPLETLQPPYDMFRRAIEDAVLPYCEAHDLGVLVYGPLAHGLLTGAIRTSTVFSTDDWRSHSPDFSGETFERNLAVVDRLHDFATDRDVSLPALAIGWALANPVVDAAIVGIRNPDELRDAVSAVDVALSSAELTEIDQILADAAPMQGPSPEGS
jgi:aryl-alcohol dehydrogenase-like predicted oxidoreductase